MHTDRNALKAGIFIVASGILIIAVVGGIKGIGRLIEPHQTRNATFKLTDDIGGLKVGDEVRVGGLKVGIVRSIEIQTPKNDEPPPIIITFNMPRRLVLRDGARIGVQTTLTGTTWLNIDSLGAGKALADDVALLGRPSPGTLLMDSLGQAGPDLAGVIHDVRTVTLPKVNDTVTSFKGTGEHAEQLLAHVQTKVDPVVERYNKFADTATGAMGEVKDILGDTKPDIRGTLSNLNTATGTIKEKLPPVMEKLDGALTKVQTSLDSANAALEDVKKTMTNARDLSVSARSIVVGNRGKIDNIVSSMKTAGDNLKFATAEVRRSPWRLLYKPNKGEMANLNVYDAARQFAEGANNLNDAATALRDAMKDPNADPATLQKLVEKLDESFNGFQKVEADLWKRVGE